MTSGLRHVQTETNTLLSYRTLFRERSTSVARSIIHIFKKLSSMTLGMKKLEAVLE
jgi:hypothetical protein